MQNVFHNKRNIKLISLLFIVAMLFCTLDSQELFLNSRSRVNSDKSLSLINNLGEISLAFYAKADDYKEVSLKKTSVGYTGKAFGRSVSLNMHLLPASILLCMGLGFFFFIFKEVRCNRLIIISYIHKLDGMKP